MRWGGLTYRELQRMIREADDIDVALTSKGDVLYAALLTGGRSPRPNVARSWSDLSDPSIRMPDGIRCVVFDMDETFLLNDTGSDLRDEIVPFFTRLFPTLMAHGTIVAVASYNDLIIRNVSGGYRKTHDTQYGTGGPGLVRRVLREAVEMRAEALNMRASPSLLHQVDQIPVASWFPGYYNRKGVPVYYDSDIDYFSDRHQKRSLRVDKRGHIRFIREQIRKTYGKKAVPNWSQIAFFDDNDENVTNMNCYENGRGRPKTQCLDSHKVVQVNPKRGITPADWSRLIRWDSI